MYYNKLGTNLIFYNGGVTMSFFSFFNKKRKKQNKYQLNILQKNSHLEICGQVLKEEYYVTEIWLFNREDPTDKYCMATQGPAGSFSFQIHLEDIIEKLEIDDKNKVGSYDWYFKVRYLATKVSKKRNLSNVSFIQENGKEYVEYFIRSGRFQHTVIKGLNYFNYKGDSVLNYVTTKGNLSLIINGEPLSPTKIQIDKVKSKKGFLRLKGKIFTRNSVIKASQVYLLGRESEIELTSDRLTVQHLKKESSLKYGLNQYLFEMEINVVHMNNGNVLPEDVFDLFIKLKLHDSMEEKLVRIGRPTRRAKLFLKEFYSIVGNEAVVVNPYYTFKKNNLSFEIYNYSAESYKYLRKLTRFSWLIRLFNKRKKVWIVGERIYKAQDTGFSFFKYMRTKYPDKNVYYVIDKDSPERNRVEPYGNVIEYKSKEHIFKTIIAEKVISSHHPDYLYPLRTPRFKKKIKADKVFLQHGVMGTKNMVANYGKNAYGFDTDLFMVSSDFEKDMIVNDFGYDPDEVYVTGLSRFDDLFQEDTNLKSQILIIPTWRDWIVTDEAFFDSEYYERYRHLINSEELKELANKYGFKIVFCLHPNMQRFSSYFNNDYVKVVNQGEISVQTLIKESALLITDYSSVAFDFSFLHKPVLYYQFDRARFLGARPSHLDLDNELPGEIAFENVELLQLIKEYADNDFKMKEHYKERANKFINYRDQNSRERIYNVIRNNTVKKSISDNQNYKLVKEAIYNKFRKSKNYYPTMKFFYKVGQWIIPTDKKLILFESGIGKQFGDSPRNIYEEILNQNLPYKKIWVYNKHHRFSDENTKKIKRLSPQYYYYLLRASYWVNNQNFPTYITKRKKTTYLQTWHGTPLKKMLYDIEEVQGRTEDYVDRVGAAVQNWDYLLSPSAYASNAFRSAFKYDGEIIESGYPRNDIFYSENQEELKRKVLNRIHLTNGKKIILYAPTFRDNQAATKNKFLFDIKMDLNKMKDCLGEDYVILLRMHVVVQNKLNLDDSLSDFVYNVSNYPDIQELLLISDILITDYSSVMFDFANTKKPMLFFTYDFEEYRDNIRGFYMDFEEEAPGPLLKDTDELIESITNLSIVQENYKEKYKLFYKKYCYLDDGRASQRVVESIFK